MAETDKPASSVERHVKFMRSCYDGHPEEQKAGYRSGLFDAAHLADALAADILKTRRPSKARDAEVANLKAFGDRIWAFKEDIRSSPKKEPDNG